MKPWKILLILSFLLAIVIGCIVLFYHNGPKTSSSPYGTLSKTDTLYMEVKKDTVTQTSLTYHIYNLTNEELYYGVDYEIEVYRNNEWRHFDVEAAWIEIAVILPAHGKNEETIEWTNIYGKLPKGQYRLIKTVNNILIWDTFEI
jgi:hypothetical protein